MAASLKKVLKIGLPIALGLFLVWYSYHNTTPEDRSLIWKYIREADLFWVGISVILGALSHISRAIRWNYLLEPMGYKPKLSNNILMVFMAYFANLGIPRTGEVLRATALATYEEVPFEKGFGTIVTERVIDVVMTLLIIGLALLLQTDIIWGYLQESGLNIKGLVLLGVAALGVGAFGWYFIQKSSHPLAVKIKTFALGLLEGILSIFKMKHKWAFLAHTLFIWAAYVAMLWVIKYTVPETTSLDFGQLLVAFVAGTFAMATTNGGIGLYPLAIRGALLLFGYSAVAGDALGWIMWIAQTLMIVLFGAISFLLLPLLNKSK